MTDTTKHKTSEWEKEIGLILTDFRMHCHDLPGHLTEVEAGKRLVELFRSQKLELLEQAICILKKDHDTWTDKTTVGVQVRMQLEENMSQLAALKEKV